MTKDAQNQIAADPALVTAPKIAAAITEIVRRANPVRVVAFGSRARGTHRAESDLDLAVIVDHYNPQLDRRPIWRADVDVWMDMDLLLYDVDRDLQMSASPATVQAEVRREGVVLFERETGRVDHAAIARLI